MIHQSFVREVLDAEQRANLSHVGDGAGEEMPGLWIRLPLRRVCGEHFRRVALRVEGNGQEDDVLAELLGESLLQDAEVVGDAQTDRKSTRLNSSHLGISYAVFC